MLLGVPMVVTFPVAVFFCRYRVARRKQISYETLVASAACIPALLGMLAFVGWVVDSFSHGPEVIVGKGPELYVLFILALMAGMCLLPALCAVVYYQKRSRRVEPPKA